VAKRRSTELGLSQFIFCRWEHPSTSTPAGPSRREATTPGPLGAGRACNRSGTRRLRRPESRRAPSTRRRCRTIARRWAGRRSTRARAACFLCRVARRLAQRRSRAGPCARAPRRAPCPWPRPASARSLAPTGTHSPHSFSLSLSVSLPFFCAHQAHRLLHGALMNEGAVRPTQCLLQLAHVR